MIRGSSRLLAVALVLVATGSAARAAAPGAAPPDDWTGTVVYRVPVTEAVIALTFDDGPRSPYTEAILDVLADQGVVATFFLVGDNTRRHPELARRITREGHTVASHGMSHRSFAELSSAEIHREIEDGAGAIQAATGVYPRLLRPPYGAFDSRLAGSRGIAAVHGQTLVMWSVQTRDWGTRSPLEIAVGTVRQVGPGSIVLLHDGGGNREHVVTATRWMIGHLARQGYRFLTVPDLLDMAWTSRRRR